MRSFEINNWQARSRAGEQTCSEPLQSPVHPYPHYVATFRNISRLDLLYLKGTVQHTENTEHRSSLYSRCLSPARCKVERGGWPGLKIAHLEVKISTA